MGDNTALRRSLLRDQAGACFYCGRQMVMADGNLAVTVDHRIPKCQGGPDQRDNIVGACWQCNCLKGNMRDTEFVTARAALIERVGLPVHGIKALGAQRARRQRDAYDVAESSFDPPPALRPVAPPLQPGPGSLGDFWPTAASGLVEPTYQTTKGNFDADRFHDLPPGPTAGTALG